MSVLSVFGNRNNDYEKKLPDFNFPKDVIKHSEAQLKEALSKNDGLSVIDALVKYSIAQSSLSEETFSIVIDKLDDVIKKEKKEDIKALLLYLKSEIYKSHEDTVEGLETYTQAIANEEELKRHKIEEYPGIINSDDIGRCLCPTLYDFLKYKESGISYIYSILEEGEMQGFKLKDEYIGKDDYGKLVDYVNKYPDGIWTKDIKNKIAYIEKQNVTVDYSNQVHSTDDIILRVSSTNAKDIDINIYRLPDYHSSRSRYQLKELKLVLSKKVVFENEEKFFEVKKDVNIGKLSKGAYHISVEVNGSKNNNDIYAYNALRVKDTSYFTIDEADKDSTLTIYVDTKTGEFIKEEYEKKRYFNKPSYNPNERIEILTDLGIYRPKETANYTVLCCEVDLNKKRPLPNHKFKITLYNSKHEELLSDTLVTDSFGQLSGKLQIPDNQANGEFCIEAKDVTPNVGWAQTTKFITVSEYKTPTFYIDLSENKEYYDKDKDVVISGMCKTYSGIPVADREVEIEVNSRIWFWRGFGHSEDETIILSATTDANGRFEAILNPKKVNTYNRFFEISATVTDEAGESQEGHHHFFIGHLRGISYSGSTDYAIDQPILLPVNIMDSQNNIEDILVSYSIASTDDPEKILKSGKICAVKEKVDLHDLKSGSYIFRAEIDDCEDKIKETIVLYHKDDKVCPITSALWKPSSVSYVDENGLVHVKLGTAFHSHIYYFATSRTGVISKGWLDYKPGMHEFTIQTPDGNDQYVNVSFKCFFDGKLYEESVYHNYEKSACTVNLQLESFRDRIVPGSKETWTFHVTDNDNKPIGGRLALEVISEAIDNIVNNQWSYNVSLLSAHSSSFSANIWGNSYSSGEYIGPTYRSTDYSLPELYLYDQEFTWGNVYSSRYHLMYDAVGSAMPMMMKNIGTLAESAAIGSANADYQDRDGHNDKAFNNINVREDDVKVALWEPMVNVSEDGAVSVSFDVPNDNTTWKFQVFAIDNHHSSSNIIRKTMIAQRNVMVKPSLPRFLRSGDKTALMANVLNSTDEEIVADVLIELFDPRSEKLLAEKNLQVTLPANGMSAVGIPFEADDNYAYIGFRIKAVANGSGDGEQQMIPVLPSVMPVIETIPFYLNPTDGDTIISIEQFPENSQITYEYCNNPVWYCLYALPTIYDADNTTATGLMHNLYAVTLAKGLSERNRVVAEALKKIQEECKNGTKYNSNAIPFDDATAQKIIDQLCYLQNSDGGISWFDWRDRESSVYITYEVLELIGRLRKIGFELTDPKIQSLEVRALEYYEEEQLKTLEEMQKLAKESKIKVDYNHFDSYLYLRTLYPSDRFVLPKANAKLLKKTLSSIEDNWRNFSLPTRTFAALSLFRNGKEKTAKVIMESMRQFAMRDSRRGMFWDNLQTFGYRWVQRTALTAHMLEAFNEIDPRKEELDEIRKWILLEKQTTDWGTSSMASEATYSLLATGSEWLNSSDCEYHKEEIENRDSIAISHNKGVPAWGAVYAKFPSKITDTKAFKLQEIELTKELYKHDGGKIVGLTDIHVGDKLQVRLTINTDRDMQYVTINDNRASCFEPVDKTSRYQFSDTSIKNRQTMGYYNDIKDNKNRIMIYFLPKGSHIITYDVYVTNYGEFCTGLADVTCEYAPQFTAHTAGNIITVKE